MNEATKQRPQALSPLQPLRDGLSAERSQSADRGDLPHSWLYSPLLPGINALCADTQQRGELIRGKFQASPIEPQTFGRELVVPCEFRCNFLLLRRLFFLLQLRQFTFNLP